MSQGLPGPCLALEGKEPSPNRPKEAETPGSLPSHLPPIPAHGLQEGPERNKDREQLSITGITLFFVGHEAGGQVKDIWFVFSLID